MFKTLKDFSFKEKRVLVRVDFNVPLSDGRVTDITRIEAALPTIEYLIREDARVILMSHLGRPKGKVIEELRMDPVAKELSNLLQKEVLKVDDCIGPEVKEAVDQMKPGDVLLLENTRFHAEEKANDPEFAKALAENADIFINDAFGTAHRAHASTAGVAQYLPSGAGFLMQRELNALGRVMEAPERPFVAILGGAKVSDKIGVIDNLLNKVDRILIGGGMANTFLKARGLEMGASLVEEDKIEDAQRLLQKAQEKRVDFVLPVDLVVAAEFKEDAESKVVAVDSVPADWQALDIGFESVKLFKGKLQDARTVIWNGPMGVFEMEPFAKGTEEIVRELARLSARTVIGGGDSAAAVKKTGLEDKMTHISTGGGASLAFLEGKPLPGVEALDKVED